MKKKIENICAIVLKFGLYLSGVLFIFLFYLVMKDQFVILPNCGRLILSILAWSTLFSLLLTVVASIIADSIKKH